MNVQFALTAFELLQFEYMSVSPHAQRVPVKERVEFLGKHEKSSIFYILWGHNFLSGYNRFKYEKMNI